MRSALQLSAICILSLFSLCQCMTVDPLDTKTEVTKSLLVKPPPSSLFRSSGALYEDTFAVMKPFIDIAAVTSDKWKYSIRGNSFYSAGMLDSPDLLKHEIFDEAKEEMNWYSFITKKFRFRNYILPEEGHDSHREIGQELFILENKLDSNKMDTIPLSETLVSLLKPYAASYFIIYHQKMRYWWETFGHYGHPAVYFRTRIFILDKKKKRVFFYNRSYCNASKRRLLRKFKKSYLY